MELSQCLNEKFGCVNPNRAEGGGGSNQPALCSDGNSPLGSGGPKYCDFSLFIMYFKKIKKKNWFSQCFWVI